MQSEDLTLAQWIVQVWLRFKGGYFAKTKVWQNRPSSFHCRFWRNVDFRVSKDSAVSVVKKAFDSGINYFDTAKLDGDSEEKIGAALKGVRDKCVIQPKLSQEQNMNRWKTSKAVLKDSKQTDWI